MTAAIALACRALHAAVLPRTLVVTPLLEQVPAGLPDFPLDIGRQVIPGVGFVVSDDFHVVAIGGFDRPKVGQVQAGIDSLQAVQRVPKKVPVRNFVEPTRRDNILLAEEPLTKHFVANYVIRFIDRLGVLHEFPRTAQHPLDIGDRLYEFRQFTRVSRELVITEIGMLFVDREVLFNDSRTSSYC